MRWLNTGISLYRLEMFEYFDMYIDIDKNEHLIKNIRGYYKGNNNEIQYRIIYIDHDLTTSSLLLIKVFDRLTLAIARDDIEMINVKELEKDDSPLVMELMTIPKKEQEQDNPFKPPYIFDIRKWMYPHYDDVPENCRYCSNHPSNGGSGICHCILGTSPVMCDTTYNCEVKNDNA